MARLMVWILVLALLAGGAFWLAGRDATVPQTRVEKVIPADALPK